MTESPRRRRRPEVCAVVVTYRPDTGALRELLHAVAPQVGSLVIVDNTAPSDVGQFADAVPAGAIVAHLRGNEGLAAAQNIGIAEARRAGSTYVLLLDQDSTPDQYMVAGLLSAFERCADKERVAAVGPRFHDLREDRDAPFVKVGFPFNRKLWCERAEQVVECDFLISSGALIPLGAIDAIGEMDAGLFIDNVDLEWSFRARARGYTMYGVCAATMHHRLGDARCRLPFGLGQVVVHGPIRLYYMMRNRVRLYRIPHTPRLWVAQDLPRVVVKLCLFGVLVGPRLRNLRFMLRGLWDGVRGKTGPCPLV